MSLELGKTGSVRPETAREQAQKVLEAWRLMLETLAETSARNVALAVNVDDEAVLHELVHLGGGSVERRGAPGSEYGIYAKSTFPASGHRLTVFGPTRRQSHRDTLAAWHRNHNIDGGES